MTLLDATVRVSLILAAALLAVTGLKRQSAPMRHWLLATAVVCAAAAPWLGMVAPAWRAPLVARHSETATSAEDAAPLKRDAADVSFVATSAAPDVPPARPRWSFAAILLWIWAAGAIVGLVGLAAGLARLRRITARSETVVDPLWDDVRDAIARQLRLSRSVTLLRSDYGGLLVTWGVFAPKVLVPESAAAWSPERVRIVLAHELAHVARADWPVQIVAELLRAVYWFNPLVWLACRRLREEAEHACDDAVLRLGIDGSDYATQLLELARAMPMRHRWVPAQAILRSSSFERRVAAMLNPRVNRVPPGGRARAIAAIALASVTVLAAGFSSAQGLTVLSGTVTDQLGGPLTNAPIVLTNPATGARYEVRTNPAGEYEFVALPGGAYTLTSEVMGFAPVRQSILLSGPRQRHDLTPRIGTIQESITITNAPSPTPRPAPAPDVRRLDEQRRVRERLTTSCGAAGGCLAPPIKIVDKKPVYPDSYSGAGDVVELKAIIDVTGHVSSVQAVGQPDPGLAQSAIAAVSAWEFEPTRLNGVVVATEMNVTVMFKSMR